MTVIDAENFTGYEDSSPTARMQASYTDLILIVCSVALFLIAAADILYRTNGSMYLRDSSKQSWTTCIR